MENFTEDKANFGSISNRVMLVVDVVIFCLVLVVYLAGRDEPCSANLEDLMLTYLIFKGLFCIYRFTIWILDGNVSQVGSYCLTCYLILWIPSMGSYYVVQLLDFFRSDTKDCRNNASTKWTGSLIIAIEGILCLTLLLGLLIVLLVWASWLVLKSCKNNPDPKYEVDAMNTARTIKTGKIASHYNVDSRMSF
ncbi:unnamed protein product [Moneuplotes crassus]|uniref:Transmembrane protein n=1 Tax=Euplotes crassus TaxID=5936 RepID=A0AAD1XXD3_EUPCR|nr:unnamed protein product [Moneuplotes crassus]